MTNLPLSPREKRAKAAIAIGFITLCIVFALICVYGKDWPTDEQVQDTPNGGYAR